MVIKNSIEQENGKNARKYVLTGGPSIGKTTILKLAKERGICTLDETATYIIERELKKPESEQIVPWKNCYDFQRNVYNLQRKWESEISADTAILDRGFVDCLAYLKLRGFENSELYNEIKDTAMKERYDKVLILDPLPFVESTEVRRDGDFAKKLHELVQESYENLGYNCEKVPVLNPKERFEYILTKLGGK